MFAQGQNGEIHKSFPTNNSKYELKYENFPKKLHC